MTTDTDTSVEGLQAQLVEVRARFVELSEADEGLSGGFRAIAKGLGALLDDLEADAETHQARLQVVVSGLSTLADLMAGRDQTGDLSEDAPASADSDDPAAEFREMFRTEARKRLSGLSISMMGIFSETASADALGQTADHLHAMKGASAMVGLSTISKLVAAMERLVLGMKNQAPEQRAWPTSALMRGFHLLEAAVADAELGVDKREAEEVIQRLETYRDAATSAPPGRVTEELPQQTRDEQPTAPTSALASMNDYDGPVEKRILIVDDVETIAASVGFILSDLDVPIDMAKHGEHALELLRERPYSLVISDVSMPRMDGVALTRMIRAEPATSEIPVILLTSLDRPDERDAGIEAGATDYIIKGSIGGGELLGRVTELLEIAPDVPAGDLHGHGAQRRVLIAEDVETIAASIAFVLSEGPFEIEIARNGAKALSRLRKESFDLLLSDVQMPEMSGLELLRTIRVDEALSELPVILLTSLQDPGVQQEALDAGADRFLIKGEVGSDALRTVVEQVADNQRELSSDQETDAQ